MVKLRPRDYVSFMVKKTQRFELIGCMHGADHSYGNRRTSQITLIIATLDFVSMKYMYSSRDFQPKLNFWNSLWLNSW